MTTVILETSPDGKNWTTIIQKDVESLDLLSGLQVRLRYEQKPTTTITSSTSTTSTSTLAPTTSTTTSTQPPSIQYILTPPDTGRLVIDNSGGKYKPGDTIQLRGVFKSINISNLSGTKDKPIKITNYPGEKLIIGDSAWNGGGYSNAFTMGNCHFIQMFGETKSNLVFQGSTQSQRTAYSTVYLSKLTDNIEVYNFTLKDGGTGFVCKTDPTTDAKTNNNGTTLSNFSFHDFEVYNTLHEGLYIGHTATYWNLTSNAPFYGTIGDTSTGWVATANYVEPLKLNNVLIYNGYLHDIGYDGIQTAAVNNLEIYKNVVDNYGIGKHAGDMSGICSGGKNSNVKIHDNIIKNGEGEFMYVFGSGEGGTAYHLIYNNLCYNNRNNDGITIRGTNKLQVKITNNTIASVPGSLIRVNSYFEKSTKPPMIISNNKLIRPLSNGGTIYDKYYIYLENGATVTETNNLKYPTLTAAGYDSNMNQLPGIIPTEGIGYK